MAAGGKRSGAGRKPKADEARLRDLLSPYIPDAVAKVIDIMNHGEKSSDQLAAAKLVLAYQFGQPSQSIDHTTKGERITQPQITVMDKDDATAIKNFYGTDK